MRHLYSHAALCSAVCLAGIPPAQGLGQESRPASSPATAPASAPAEDPALGVARAHITPWKPIFVGVQMCEGSTRAFRPVQMRAIRVDLHEPGIGFLVTPSNGSQPLDVNARTTSDFLTEFRCQAAINGSFFTPLATQPGDPEDIRGLSVSRGDLYSPSDNAFAALLIGKDRRVWIASAPIDARQAYNGLAGETTLLINGQYSLALDDQRPITVVRHPRSAAGISRDGRYLVLMTIDGRQPGYSEGATKAETAEWLRRLGAWNALNLDGGGSTTLVIEGADGRPVVLNRPCGPPVGTQRRVANHLGVFAKRLAGGQVRGSDH
jgi:hypothetical protein